jgi:hypothetical protein
MKCMVVVALALVAIPASAQTSEDEKTIRKLEQEWPSHIGLTQADIDFQKRIMTDKMITIDNVGHIIVYSGKDIDALAKADPDVKSSGETTNLKIYFYGPDTAIATYNVHFIQTGHKDKKYNSDLELSCLDVWKKLNGEWKALAGSNTSTKPVLPEMYKMEMPPNFPSPTS